MNRREFFKAASVAPVAVPMAVSAALAKPDPFLIRMSVRHADRAIDWVTIPEAVGRFRMPLEFPSGMYEAAVKLTEHSEPDPSVEAQMREHDLFERAPH